MITEEKGRRRVARNKNRKPAIHTFKEGLDLGLSVCQSPGMLSASPSAPEIATPGRTGAKPASAERFKIIRSLASPDGIPRHLAFDRDLNRRVVLKVARTDEQKAALAAECEVLGKLEHPNILPVHTIARAPDGSLFAVFQHAEGRTLSDVVRGRLDAKRSHGPTHLLLIVQQVCWAVEFAHTQGIGHGALCADNVVLGDQGEVTVVGWSASPVGVTLDRSRDVRAIGELLSGSAPDPMNAVLASGGGAEHFGSARDIGVAIQAHIESRRDDEVRSGRSRAVFKTAREDLRRYRALKRSLAQHRKRERALKHRFKTWDSYETKKPIHDLQTSILALRVETAKAFNVVTNRLGEALAVNEKNQDARALLADVYFARYLEAEAAGDGPSMAFFQNLAKRYDDGRYADDFPGRASLSLATDPAGATLTLHRMVERDLVLVPEQEKGLGRSPVAIHGLRPGSYVVTLALRGYRTVRYPIRLERDAMWAGVVRLYSDKEIGREFVYVPEGPFICGGEPPAVDAEERHTRTIKGFFIMERHVTMGEYLEFVRDRQRREPDASGRLIPRVEADLPLFETDGRGRLVLSKGAFSFGTPRAALPVVGVTRSGALAYTAWKSVVDQRPYFLPTSDEWEKAARGVDGRDYPWGREFDSTLTNMLSTFRIRHLARVKSRSRDCSVYGVSDCGGNAQDLCRNTQGEYSVCRGGSWRENQNIGRLASHADLHGSVTSPKVGFRLVHYPAAAGATARNRPRKGRREMSSGAGS